MRFNLLTIVTACCLTISAATVARSEPDTILIVLLADAKDHGPAGNGKHDYPLWQKRWSRLLGGERVSQKKQVTSIQVRNAWQWPSKEQFQLADVIVAYCYIEWNGERLAQVRKYLDKGGGLVLIHSATWTKPKPSAEVGELTGVGGFRLFRHGPVSLDISGHQHPICSGLPGKIVLDEDETYWPPTPMMGSITVLATSVEERGERGKTPKAPQPMLWCYELGLGRVFGCVPGHSTNTFDDPLFRRLLLRGIAWAAGEIPSRLDGLVLREDDGE